MGRKQECLFRKKKGYLRITEPGIPRAWISLSNPTNMYTVICITLLCTKFFNYDIIVLKVKKMENRKKYDYDIAYKKEKIKRIPLDVQISEYDALKEQADSVPMNTFIKKALNFYLGKEIFKV